MDTNSNLATERRTFVSHLECGLERDRYEADRVHGLSKAGKPLLVKYDLESLRSAVGKEELARRPPDIWRYREFLPVRRVENIVSLGETHTPLIPLPRLQAGGGELLIKDEGRLPTGSFKARGLCLAVSMAKELGITKVAMPTNGNAGAALAAYASRAGITSYVFCPDDTPEINVREIAAQGAKVWRVNGLINDCGRIVGEGKEAMGWFDFSTLKEPYRIEGKKTMGLELADQLGWNVPDVIFYPTGGGTGLIGMWKAFNELAAIGWLTGKLPRMVAVQASGLRRSSRRSTREPNTPRCGQTRAPWPRASACRSPWETFSSCRGCARAAVSRWRLTMTRYWLPATRSPEAKDF